MTCINCQNKIQKALAGLPGVKKASVSYQSGTAQVVYDPGKISQNRITQVIEQLGYEVLPENRARRPEIVRVTGFLAVILALYGLLEHFGVLNLLVPSQLADSGMGYGMLFVVGLLTSVHCIAMCGGINLSQCLPNGISGNESQKRSAFLPSFLYNLGRVVSYTVMGFLLGLVGWLLGGNSGAGLPTWIQGVMKMAAGAVMVIMGINMLGLFPWLRRLTLRMPGFLAKKAGKKRAADRRPFVVGLLNGLMPCGPLQSMQILALASGSPIAGGLSMLLFSLGTVPLMLGLGTLVSALGKRFAHAVSNIGAVLVAVLGLAMAAQGGSLSGLIAPKTLLLAAIVLSVVGITASIPCSRKVHRVLIVAVSAALVSTAVAVRQQADQGKTLDLQIVDGVQIVNSTLQPRQYPTITVQAGIPVKWTIDAPAGSVNGCNDVMLIPEYGIQYVFKEGKNIIEFTPTETGTIPYTCWMGMIRGSIVVI